MHRNRIKQAQSLLKKAGKASESQGKLKNLTEGKIDSSIYEEILNKIIKTEEFIYTSRPSHHLLKDDAEEFCSDLIEIRNKIDEILAEFGVLEKENVEEKVKSLSERFIFLTTKGNFKKLLTRWGVEPQRIVVAGVPLEAEDMRILNPNIPESAFEPIKKKISHVKNDINRKMKDLDCKNVLIVVEKDKSGKILAKRANNIYGAFVIEKDKLKDVDVIEFKRSLEKLSLS